MNTLEGRSDAELLELSMAGEENAFRILYERLKTPIFRYAFHMTASQTAAEEVVQEIFVLLLKNGNKYRKAKGEVSAFAFGIARNFVRRLKRREHVYQELPNDEGLAKMAANAVPNEGISAQLIRDQDVARVRTAVASLPDHYRQVIVLCDLCDLTYLEAATRMQCAVGTVRSRLNRAHQLLAQKLKQSAKPRVELPATGPEECLI